MVRFEILIFQINLAIFSSVLQSEGLSQGFSTGGIPHQGGILY